MENKQFLEIIINPLHELSPPLEDTEEVIELSRKFTPLLEQFINHLKYHKEWIKRQFERIEELLYEQGIEPHEENVEGFKNYNLRHSFSNCSLFQYKLLCRVLINALEDPDWTFVPFENNKLKDDHLSNIFNRIRSKNDLKYDEHHLLTHSNRRGYFIPVDFKKTIWDPIDPEDDESVICISSSYKLMKDLILIAPYLEIPLYNGVLKDNRASWLEEWFSENIDKFSAVSLDIKFGNERWAWIYLFEAAKVSIENNFSLLLEGTHYLPHKDIFTKST